MSSRIDRLAVLVGPRQRLLLLVGLLTSLVLANSWQEALALVILCYLLAFLAGKRVQLSYFFVLACSVVFFSLLNPFGKVEWQWGPFLFTQGALDVGLLRAFRLIGMVFASLASIHRGLQLPGKAGGFLSETLGYYDRLLQSRHRLSLHRWIESVDSILSEVYPLPKVPGVLPIETETSATNSLVAFAVILGTWAAAGAILWFV